MRAPVVAAAASLALAAQAAGAGAPPSLRLVDRSPVTVRVAGFTARERVTVTVSAAGQRWTRAGVTTGRGILRLAFPGVTLARCGFYSLRALGARGDAARFTSPAAMCMP